MTRLLPIVIVTLAGLALWADEPKRPAESEKADRLRHNLAVFRGLSPERQQRLRAFDRALAELTEDDRDQLLRVMQRYSEWLSRLPQTDREAIAAAEAGPPRLAVVRGVLDRRWRETLPPQYREQLTDKTPQQQQELVTKWKADDERWRQMRFTARRAVEEFSPNLQQRKMLNELQSYIDDTLRPLLDPADEARLNALIDDGLFSPRGNRLVLMGQLLDLARKAGPVPLPGPAPPGRKKAIRRLDDLPPEARKVVAKAIAQAPPDVQQRLRGLEGKWPQFAIAASELGRKVDANLPGTAFGPTRLNELPRMAKKFVADELAVKLTADEAEYLKQAETKWPEYPRAVVELAGRYQLTVPGLRTFDPRDLPGKMRDAKSKFDK